MSKRTAHFVNATSLISQIANILPLRGPLELDHLAPCFATISSAHCHLGSDARASFRAMPCTRAAHGSRRIMGWIWIRAGRSEHALQAKLPTVCRYGALWSSTTQCHALPRYVLHTATGQQCQSLFLCTVVHWSGARFPTEYGLDMDTSWSH